MITRVRFCIAVMLAAVAAPAVASAQAIVFAPHRAVYELALTATRKDKQIEQARGRIAFEFTGDSCKGFETKFRQVTQLSDGEGQARVSDVKTNTWESGSGSGFRFDTQTKTDQVVTVQGEGKAQRGSDGGVSVKLQKPRPQRLDLEGTAVFPTSHLRMLIEQARNDVHFFSVKLFDGSDGGGKLFDTTAVIGKEIPAGSTERIDAVMEKAGLDKFRRWPVTLSYFEPGVGERTPLYVMSFDLFENGVSGPLKFDFGDFSMTGEISRLEMLPAVACTK